MEILMGRLLRLRGAEMTSKRHAKPDTDMRKNKFIRETRVGPMVALERARQVLETGQIDEVFYQAVDNLRKGGDAESKFLNRGQALAKIEGWRDDFIGYLDVDVENGIYFDGRVLEYECGGDNSRILLAGVGVGRLEPDVMRTGGHFVKVSGVDRRIYVRYGGGK